MSAIHALQSHCGLMIFAKQNGSLIVMLSNNGCYSSDSFYQNLRLIICLIRKSSMAINTLIPKFNKPLLATAVTVGLATLLTACGGGGGSSSSTSTPSINTQTPSNNPNSTVDVAGAPEQATLNLLNYNRTQCGFGALTPNQALNTATSNHANYLKSVSESNQMAFASHNEQAETLSNGVVLSNTGVTNPYYSGLTLGDRLNPTTLGTAAVRTQYPNNGYVENLGMTSIQTTNMNYVVDKVTATENSLRGLFAAPYHMQGLLHPAFKEVGISYQLAQWQNGGYRTFGNILELAAALPMNSGVTEPTRTLNFPCDNVVTAYELNNEYPNPFGTTRDLATHPVGQPIYVRGVANKAIVAISGTVSTNGQASSNLYTLTASNDPNKILQPNEAMLIPLNPLQPDTTYQASYQVKFSDGSTENQNFSFRTQAKTL